MLAFSLYLVTSAEQVGAWLRAKPWQRGLRTQQQDPVLFVYALMLMMSGAILFLTPFVFDRYLLPVLPLLMVAALRHKSRAYSGVGGRGYERQRGAVGDHGSVFQGLTPGP